MSHLRMLRNKYGKAHLTYAVAVAILEVRLNATYHTLGTLPYACDVVVVDMGVLYLCLYNVSSVGDKSHSISLC